VADVAAILHEWVHTVPAAAAEASPSAPAADSATPAA